MILTKKPVCFVLGTIPIYKSFQFYKTNPEDKQKTPFLLKLEHIPFSSQNVILYHMIRVWRVNGR